MKRKRRLHLVAVKLSDRQLELLDAEVRRQQALEEEVRVTRSSVLRRALLEFANAHAA
jgi:hypothetical protein